MAKKTVDEHRKGKERAMLTFVAFMSDKKLTVWHWNVYLGHT